MKRFLFISLLYLITFSVSAQKVTIKVLQSKIKGFTGWQVLDASNNTAFSGEGYMQDDTVTFGLEANKYYFLKISVSEITNRDTLLCSLILNGEPILFIKSDIGDGDHLLPFFTGIKTINAKITGGTSTLISDFPWQVYYISGNYRCGGSIISNRWVVTAAHCTETDFGIAIPADSMFIQVGANNPVYNKNDGKIYAVSQAIVNEGFDSQTLLNDIALLRLKDTINYVNATPIKFVTSEDVHASAIVPGVMSWVTGWGLTSVNPYVRPTSLQKVQLPIVSNAQASTVWGSIPVTDLMAGYLNGNKDACNGDSGGPLVVPVLGEYKLAGLVSWGSDNCNTYGAYTRISDFETWIRTKTGIAKGFIPPAPTGNALVCQGTESTQYSVQTIPGASAYEWKLFPSYAGTISGNGPNASVLWDISYTGTITIALRVTINNKVSEWSQLIGNVVLNTALIKQSDDTTICTGEPVTLNVSAIGYNLIYSWFMNGQAVQTGASSTFNISASTMNYTGLYKCQVTGSCGVVLSNTINLTVYPLTNINHISPGGEFPFGNDITLDVSADGRDLEYQWQKDGNALSNSNSSELFLPNVNASDIGIYKTTVTGTCGTRISEPIYVYVKKENSTADPEVFLWPSITSTEFTVALSNDSFYNVQMYNTTGKKIKELTKCRYQTAINISTLANGVYIVEVFNSDFRRTIRMIKE